MRKYIKSLVCIVSLCIGVHMLTAAMWIPGSGQGDNSGPGVWKQSTNNAYRMTYEQLENLCLTANVALQGNHYIVIQGDYHDGMFCKLWEQNGIYSIRLYQYDSTVTNYYLCVDNDTVTGGRYWAYAPKDDSNTWKPFYDYLEDIKQNIGSMTGSLLRIERAFLGYGNDIGYIAKVINFFNDLSQKIANISTNSNNIKSNTDYIDDIYSAVNSNNIWVSNQTTYSDHTTSNPHQYPYLDVSFETANNMIAQMNTQYLGKPIKAIDRDADNTVAVSTWVFSGAYLDSSNVLRIRYELSSGTNGNGYAITPQHYLIRVIDGSNVWVTNVSNNLNSWTAWTISYDMAMSIIDSINNSNGYIKFVDTSNSVVESRVAVVGTPYITESTPHLIKVVGRNATGDNTSTYTVVTGDRKVINVTDQNNPILTAINNIDVSIRTTNFYPTMVNFMTEINANIDSLVDTIDANFDVSIDSLIDNIDANFDDIIDTIEHQADSSDIIPYIDQLESNTDYIESYLESIKANTYTTINNAQYSVADLIAIADQGITSINNALVWGSGNDAMSLSQINKAILDWLDDDSLQNDIHILNLLNTWEEELQYGINNSSQILNLFNTAYSDMLLPPQPGTWANAGSYFTMLYRGDQ